MHHDDQAVLAVPADVDHRAVDAIYERAAALLRPGVGRLVVDLTETRFLDSTGIGLLVRIKSLADIDACSVVLRNASPRILRTLELAGMADYLPSESAPMSPPDSSP